MTYKDPARTAARRTRPPILSALLVIGTVLVGVLVYQSLATSPSSVASPIDTLPSKTAPAVTVTESHPSAPEDPGQHDESDRRDERHPEMPLGEDDGAVGDGVTVLDDHLPAVAKLNPQLLAALRRAAIDAADDGVEFLVSSGWRSPDYQEQLLQEAVSEYGSEEEAARWVATAETSAHVTGDAVDIAPYDAIAWLSEHGAEYGLCQIYSNEPWHFELHPEAIDDSCPPMYADPTHDPSMQQ